MTISKKFAVVGHPLHHSLSPIIFNSAFDSLGLDYLYLKEDINPTDLKSAIDKLRDGYYQGFSVTVPYKEMVLQYLDKLTPEASIIKAVNTIYNVNGEIIGENTDWIGFITALTEEVDVKDKKILIYGAGGAARACLFALSNYKENTFLTNRTSEKGEALADEFKVKFVNKDLLPEVDIFINATSIGLNKNEEILVTKDWLKNTKVVFDLLYGETRLSQTAKSLGIKTINAKKMLLYQSVRQFKIFTGMEAPVKIISESIGLE